MLVKPYLLAALTGSIGSGKSAAADIFASLGAKIIDADVLAREVVAPGEPALTDIVKTFGSDILGSDGTLNRKTLGQIVFADPAARSKLEQIVHPRIRELFEKKKSEFEKTALPNPVLLYVIPLLFESKNSYPEFEKIIVVSAPREECIRRILKRDDCSRELAERKLDSQIPIEEKVKRADYVIYNHGTLAELRGSVSSIYEQLLKLI